MAACVETVYFVARPTSATTVQACYILSPSYNPGSAGANHWWESGSACTAYTPNAWNIRTYTKGDTLTLDTGGANVGGSLTDAGGYYDVGEYHLWSTAYASDDLSLNTSVANATAVSGDLAQNWTNWPNVSTCDCGCYRPLGRIKLAANHTNPQLTFSYRAGQLKSAYDWYVGAFKFTQVPSNALTITVSGAGTTTQDYDRYYSGQTVNLTATANAGSMFVSWTQGGTVVSTNSTYTFSFGAAPLALTANFAPGHTVTAIANPTGTGTIAGARGYPEGTNCTLTATPSTGYSFGKWTSDAAGTVSLSTSNPYTFVVAGETTVYAQFTPNPHTLTTTGCANGAVGGDSGTRATNQSCTVTAIPNTLYQFKNWTTDGCGGTAVVSTSKSYTFNMPTTDYALYANFVIQPVLTLGKNLSVAGTVSGAGSFDTASSVTVTATENANFKFLYWSVLADGSGPVSAKKNYTFTMPNNDYALYAIFAKAIFAEGFDARNAGALDGNYATGPNAAANGDKNDNPWFGPVPTNLTVTGAVNGVTVNSGSKMIYSASTRNAQDDVNIAYRCNNGNPMTANFYFDWYFYDPIGTGATANLYNDYASLCYYGATALDGTTDYINANLTDPTTPPIDRIALGANSASVGTYSYGVSGSWIPVSTPRSIGWHHGRIGVGAANDVSLYIDDMIAPAATTTASGNGFNALEMMCRPTVSTNATGYFDDISILVPGTQSIDRWSTIGHFANADAASRLSTDYFAGSGFTEATVVPKIGNSLNGKTWALCNSGVVDFNKFYGAATTNGASYLFTYINNTSGSAINDVDLTCGSDDGIEVLLNGTQVLFHDIARALWQDNDHVGSLTLNQGINRLLVKIAQGTGDYKGQVKLTHADGSPLAGVTYFPSDDIAPTGTIQINGGASSTGSAHVTLTLSATDPLCSVASMQFSEDDVTYTATEPYATSKTWLLSPGNGLKTVYVKFIDTVGNVSLPFSHSIDMEVNGSSVNLTSCEPDAGGVSGGSTYPTNTPVTVVASPNPGYSFTGWTRDSCDGFDVASRNATYSFSMPYYDVLLYANFKANNYTLTTTACTGGTATGGGSYATSTGVTATATPDSTHRFVNWTSDSCGGTAVVSTNATYSFNMPPNNYTLYANFAYTPLLTINSVPAAGGTTTGGGARYNTGAAVPLVATPNAGYAFVGWSTDPAGATFVGRGPSYNYTMPATDTTLYAQFAVAHNVFSDGFETYNSNAMLDFQGPWQTDWPADGTPAAGVTFTDLWVSTGANGITPHGGSQMVTGQKPSDYDCNLLDLSYHCGGGSALTGNFQADWWFYDPNGTSATTYTDVFCLSNVVGVPGDREPLVTDSYAWNQRMSVGAYTGGDTTKYQVRIIGYTTTDGSGAYNSNGWFNTAIARSVGWHHGTVAVWPRLADHTCPVDVYIDGVLALEKNGKTTIGYNCLELAGALTASYGAFDDVNVITTEVPAVDNLTVTPSICTDTSPVSVTWTAMYANHSLLQFDGGAWVDPATSPYSIPTAGLAYGNHTVSVKCFNADGQVSNTATVTFRVDRSSIRTWNIIGHYVWDYNLGAGSTRWSKDFFDAPGISEPTICAKTGTMYTTSVTPAPNAGWTPYTSPTPIVDFNVAYGTPTLYTQWGVSYMFTYIVNNGPAIPNAFLSCGSDDGIKVWFNGVLQGGNDTYRGCAYDSDIYPATGGFTINPGPNKLLVKVTQGSTGYLAVARLCAYDGTTRTEPTWLSQLTYVQSDDQAPTGTIVVNGGAASTSNPAVTLTLSATDDLSGVATMSFSNDGVNWSTPEPYAASKAWTLSSGYGSKSVCVQFTDGAGNTSTAVCASITLVSPCSPPTGTTNVAKISDLWALVDGATVYNLTAKTVSAVWTDGFWIEETNRTAGVKVTYDPNTACTVGAAVAAGNSVDVYGTISTVDQRVLVASVVVNNGAATAIKPVGVTEKYTGGKQKSNAPAVTGGKGIYGVGLLVKLAGNVTSADTVSGTFYLDDGSGLIDGAYSGIKVYAGALAVPTSGNKEVTGVVGIVSGKPVIYATSIQ